jgi:hypothetical protein
VPYADFGDPQSLNLYGNVHCAAKAKELNIKILEGNNRN